MEFNLLISWLVVHRKSKRKLSRSSSTESDGVVDQKRRVVLQSVESPRKEDNLSPESKKFIQAMTSGNDSLENLMFGPCLPPAAPNKSDGFERFIQVDSSPSGAGNVERRKHAKKKKKRLRSESSSSSGVRPRKSVKKSGKKRRSEISLSPNDDAKLTSSANRRRSCVDNRSRKVTVGSRRSSSHSSEENHVNNRNGSPGEQQQRKSSQSPEFNVARPINRRRKSRKDSAHKRQKRSSSSSSSSSVDQQKSSSKTNISKRWNRSPSVDRKRYRNRSSSVDRKRKRSSSSSVDRKRRGNLSSSVERKRCHSRSPSIESKNQLSSSVLFDRKATSGICLDKTKARRGSYQGYQNRRSFGDYQKNLKISKFCCFRLPSETFIWTKKRQDRPGWKTTEMVKRKLAIRRQNWINGQPEEKTFSR